MKILEFSFENFGVFEEKQTLLFETKKRVMKDELTSRVSIVNGAKYNNLTTIFGANATGKSTIMNGLLAINSMISNEFYNIGFYFKEKDQKVKLSYRFVADEFFVNIDLVIGWNDTKAVAKFESEEIRICSSNKFEVDNTSIIKRDGNNNVSFINSELFLSGEFNDNNIFFVADSMSILHLIFGQDKLKFNDKTVFILATTEYMHHSNIWDNTDLIKIAMKTDSDFHLVDKMIKIADPAIEYLRYSQSQKEFELKFVTSDLVYKRDKFSDIANLLSLGTKKIAILSIQIERSLINGLPLIIDEIENSLHKKLIDLIISLYTMENMNKNHAQLIMTTHSIETLNKAFRDDSYYYTELLIDNKKYKYSLNELKTDRDNKLTLKGKASIEGKIFKHPSSRNINKLIMEYNNED